MTAASAVFSPRSTAPLTSVRSSRRRSPGFAEVLACALVGAFLLRVSLLRSVVPPSNSALQLASLSLLAAAVLMHFVREPARFRFSALLAMALPGFSLLTTDDLSHSLFRYSGWLIMMLAVGPVFTGAGAAAFRRTALNALVWMAHLVAWLSLVWIAAGLPVMGFGIYTGVMYHVMILAPLSAVSAIAAMARSMSARSVRWLLLAVPGVILVLLCGSRAAAFGLVAGIIMLCLLRLQRAGVLVGLAVLLLGVFVAADFEGAMRQFGGILPEKASERLVERDLLQTRLGTWQARIDEFASSPVAGVGFARDQYALALARLQGEQSIDSVEPGSSYLGVLSMTGALGAIGIGILLADVAWLGLRRRVPAGGAERLLLLGLVGFFAMHMVAEGYMLAVGSPLAFALWLTLGRCMDLGLERSAPAQSQSRRARIPAQPTPTVPAGGDLLGPTAGR